VRNIRAKTRCDTLNTMENKPILRMTDVGKRFLTDQGEIVILDNVSAQIMSGETVAIIGPSGSGKSTLLSLIGLLDTPTHGDIFIDEQNVKSMSEKDKAQFRNKKIGFIFQSFELISPFSVAENIAAPLEIGGRKVEAGVVEAMLAEVGLSARADALPYTLSGGEKQRVAIARALIHSPALLLADEPTGSLDRATGERVMTLLLDAVTKRDATLVVITHDETIATRMDRVFEIKNQTLHERK
jgi:putative ABC transport system ATP-binding protein